MDETCRLRRGEGYGVCADAVVSKCALREKREEGPRVPGDLLSEIYICFPSFRERYASSSDSSIA